MNTLKSKILTWKEDLITLGVIIVCLGLFFLFPSQGPAQAVTASLIFLFLVPFLYIKLILKKDLCEYGWQVGDWKKGITFAAGSLVFALLIFYALYHYTDFSKNYALPLIVTQKFGFFLLYEFVLVAFFLALYEFFFRGFVMFSFAGKLGLGTAAFQWLLFLTFLFIAGNFSWQNTPYIITGFFSGITTFKSRSLLYSFTFSLLFLLIIDAIIIKLLY
jgi:hypothetical protein